MFLAPWFAVAGLIAAAGPVLIHLLNRRRYQVRPWAAMDFLREALARSRRILQIRDIALLVVRVLCLLLFGFALARPLLAPSGAAEADAPAHAVALIDNSLSMAYEELGQTLLERAKQKARQWIEQVPPGSRFSVIPLCGSSRGASLDPYASKDDALEALAAIETLDRSASAGGALDLALEACRRVVDMPRKRIGLFADAQVTGVAPESLTASLARLPAAVEVITIEAKSPENAWVADFRLPDGVADPETPAVFLATLRYQGGPPRREVQATLTVDGAAVAAQTVELFSGQSREVRFPPCRLASKGAAGEVRFAAAAVSITHDRLPADDQRFLMVPLTAGAPIVFIDQYGRTEDPRRNLFGETWALRRLLAPATQRGATERQLFRVRHMTIDEVDRELLADARLVVLAGVADPRPALPILEEYAAQGGPVLIAAGGQFDPAAWHTAAWRGGQGLLPAPLRATLFGRSPDEPGDRLTPFQLDFGSLVHEWFQVEQTSREELQDLYAQPWFFKTAVAELNDAALAKAEAALTAKIAGEREELARLDAELTKLPPDAPQRTELETRRGRLAPHWLRWEPPSRGQEAALAPEEAAKRMRPQTLAAFGNGTPYMVARRYGNGRTVLAASGFSLGWNTLALTNAMLVYDRIVRGLILETFPNRTLTTDETRAVDLPASQRRAKLVCRNQQGEETPLAIEPVGPDRYAAIVQRPAQRGLYLVTAAGAASRSASEPAWEAALAVNGPAAESELVAPNAAAESGDAVVWAPARDARLADPPGLGSRNLWKWLMAAALCGLLLEMGLLAGPAVRRSPTA